MGHIILSLVVGFRRITFRNVFFSEGDKAVLVCIRTLKQGSKYPESGLSLKPKFGFRVEGLGFRV